MQSKRFRRSETELGFVFSVGLDLVSVSKSMFRDRRATNSDNAALALG